jgi:hypothetical protein
MFSLNEVFQWISDKIGAIYESIQNQIFALPSLIANSIPVPDFLFSMGTTSIPGAITFYTDAFELPLGLTIITSAYLARFALRRIPFIG